MPRYVFANLSDSVFKATARIDKYDTATQERIKAAIKTGTNAVFAEAVRLAPMGKTGNLKSGIKMELHNDYSHASGVVKSTAPHSHLVEFGTRQRYVTPIRRKALKINGHFAKGYINNGTMPKRPFMRPAIDKVRPSIEDGVRRAIEGE